MDSYSTRIRDKKKKFVGYLGLKYKHILCTRLWWYISLRSLYLYSYEERPPLRPQIFCSVKESHFQKLNRASPCARAVYLMKCKP